MMSDDAIKECGMHTAQEIVRNMGVSSGEGRQAITTSEDFERRMYEYAKLSEGIDRLERSQAFGVPVSAFNVVVTGLDCNDKEKVGKRENGDDEERCE